MQVSYFKRPQHYGLYHYFKVYGTGDKKQKNGYQEVINFLGETPILSTEHDRDSNGLTGTWCTFEVGIAISKQDWEEAYKLATEGDFIIC